MLKAAVAHTGVAPPRIHVIMELLSRVDGTLQDALQHLASGLQDLDRYYAPTRYPDAIVGSLPGEQEATEALATAREVASIVEGALYPSG
jgi:HEPN domain-containing protein